MAAQMVTPAIKLIILDYNRKVEELNRECDHAKTAEYARMAEEEDETKTAARVIEKQNVSLANTDASESEAEETIHPINTPYSSPTSTCSESKIIRKRTITEPQEGPAKVKKRHEKHHKPNVQYFTKDNEMLGILTALKADMAKLKADNAAIMDRLTALELPNQNAQIKGMPAATPHKGAFQSLKNTWVPQILKLLHLICNELQISTDETNV